MLTPAQAKALLAEIGASWPQRPLDEAQVAVWTDTLSKVKDVDVARATIRALRETLDFPPTHHEFLVTARREAVRMAEMRALAEQNGPCPECNGDEFVTLGHEQAGQRNGHRPCSRCLPLLFVRWQGGHTRPDHACADCRDLRKGTAEQRRQARARLLESHVPVDLEPAF